MSCERSTIDRRTAEGEGGEQRGRDEERRQVRLHRQPGEQLAAIARLSARAASRRAAINAIAVAILMSAAATGGFQISDEIAISNGADAISRHIASASAQCMRRDSATNSHISAIDCSNATVMPPACGRLSMNGPIVTRPSHSSQ